MNDGRESRWEPPIVQPMYVTLRRASELLDVPYWKMHGLSFVLDTRYFGERGGSPRVSMASIEEFIQIRDEGRDAAAVLGARKGFQGWSPYPVRPAAWQAPSVDNRSRHWRKYWYYNQ